MLEHGSARVCSCNTLANARELLEHTIAKPCSNRYKENILYSNSDATGALEFVII